MNFTFKKLTKEFSPRCHHDQTVTKNNSQISCIIPIDSETLVYNILVKKRNVSIVYNILVKKRNISIVYNILVKKRNISIVYYILVKKRHISIVYNILVKKRNISIVYNILVKKRNISIVYYRLVKKRHITSLSIFITFLIQTIFYDKLLFSSLYVVSNIDMCTKFISVQL